MSLISPGLALSVILATAYGAAFHLWRGGGYGMLVRYLLAAWCGFALGQLVGWLGGWEFVMVGQVHLLEGTLGSGLLMTIARWLAASPSAPTRAQR
jgi:ribose/xylose/arabinose/galactoside ABC-type transport system permease subunit